MALSESNLPTEECFSLNATENLMCPTGGYSTILGQIPSTFNYDPINLTVPGTSPSEGPRLLSVVTNNGEYSNNGKEYIEPYYDSAGTISTSISQILARDLGFISKPPVTTGYLHDPPTTPLYKLGDLNGIKPFKLAVQVLCNSFSPNATKFEFPHYTLNTPPFVSYGKYNDIKLPLTNIYRDETWAMDVDTVWNRTLPEEHMRTGNLSFTWVDLQKYDLRPSIAAAVAFPPTNLTTANDSTAQNIPSRILACSIDARWLLADLWTTPTLSNS